MSACRGRHTPLGAEEGGEKGGDRWGGKGAAGSKDVPRQSPTTQQGGLCLATVATLERGLWG